MARSATAALRLCYEQTGADRIYRESPLLGDAFKAELDEAMDAMRAAGPGGADLILCAQDIPGEMRYRAAAVDGETATVTVTQLWNPGTAFELLRELTVTLEKVDGRWLIAGIGCPTPWPARHRPHTQQPLAPGGAVRHSRCWLLARESQNRLGGGKTARNCKPDRKNRGVTSPQ